MNSVNPDLVLGILSIVLGFSTIIVPIVIAIIIAMKN